MRWELIESDAALAAMLAQEGPCPAVAVDTEFMRRNTFYPKVALLQLCFSDTAWLVDPLALNDTAPLCSLLQDPGTVKVLHSASEDLEVFQHWLGVCPSPLFDTQKAAALLDQQNSVHPDHVQRVFPHVLRHRLLSEAAPDADHLLTSALEQTPVP